jgi:hypothetical protein
MTTETEVKWEDVTFEDLREGDEVEYLNTGEHQEHRFWGKVLAKYADNIHLEGDWHLVKSSWKHIGDKGHIRRKVAPIKFPTRTGAVISFAYRNGDTEQVTTYVRADNRDTGYFWVETTSGERYAEWEVELVQSNATLTVISDGS